MEYKLPQDDLRSVGVICRDIRSFERLKRILYRKHEGKLQIQLAYLTDIFKLIGWRDQTVLLFEEYWQRPNGEEIFCEAQYRGLNTLEVYEKDSKIIIK